MNDQQNIILYIQVNCTVLLHYVLLENKHGLTCTFVCNIRTVFSIKQWSVSNDTNTGHSKIKH